MHAHLERGDGGARHPRDLFVRQPFYMLQHEHFTLLRRQTNQRPFERVRLLHLLHIPVGPIGPGDRFVHHLERPPLPGPTTLLGEAAVPQNQKQPSRKLGGFAALRQLIEGPHEGILDRILGRVERAEHPGGKSRIAVAVAAYQHRVLLHIPRQPGAHDFSVRRLFPFPQTEHLGRQGTQRMLDVRWGRGNRLQPKESPRETLVTSGPAVTSGQGVTSTFPPPSSCLGSPTPWGRTAPVTCGWRRFMIRTLLGLAAALLLPSLLAAQTPTIPKDHASPQGTAMATAHPPAPQHRPTHSRAD